jgi:predicted dehydrogenase
MKPVNGDRTISRRKLLTTAGAAAVATVVPRHVLGGAGYAPPSEKVHVGFIGVGAQGTRVMLDFLKHPDVQGIAVCDPMKQANDYPQWGANEYRTKVHQLLGVDSGWEWLSPNTPIQLTPSMQSAGGAAGREPAQKIINAFNAKQTGAEKHNGCKAYSDFRELLEKEKDLDAVVVCTPDHTHAPIAIAAMRKGKHVFCQKPMAHDVYAARRMAEVARETGVATQVATGNSASEDTRRLCEWVWSGAIGPVRRVINWSSRPFWAQGVARPKEAQPVPVGMDWNLWLGPAAERPFHHAYLPFVWRGWYDFGCGAQGDMGCYSFDTIFRVLKLEAPSSVEASSSERYAETYPKASIIHYDYPARADMPPARVTWYDGGLRPPRPEDLDPGVNLADEGMLLIGDRGTILCDFNGSKPRLIPDTKMKAFTEPPKTLPRSPGHEREWLDACKGGKTPPGANFGFAARVTEALQLGNVATRLGERLTWDPAKLSAGKAAEKYVRPEYRSGWEV